MNADNNIPLACAVLTVSDTRSAGDDTSATSWPRTWPRPAISACAATSCAMTST